MLLPRFLTNYARCHALTCKTARIVPFRPLMSQVTGIEYAENLGVLSQSESNNVPRSVAEKLGRNLHLIPSHPLGIIKSKIEKFFLGKSHLVEPCPNFEIYDQLSPIVNTWDNFDSLLIPEDHVSRKYTDTYYIDEGTVLRTHTSSHQVKLLKAKNPPTAFLVSGDVYRRDEVDRSHYPIFHQMEGVRVFSAEEFQEDLSDEKAKEEFVTKDLRNGLEGLAKELFGDVEMRWVDAYFPFTNPSFELEIFFGGQWLEVLGCGLIERGVLKNGEVDDGAIGWAFGLGLERLAMVLFSIPDIRLFWTEDPRFISQFKEGETTTFKPYSKYPQCYKDVSFWLNESKTFHVNDIHEIVRNIAGDLVEEILLVDEFEHPKTGKVSKCFRILYRSMDRSLTNEEIDQLQEVVREKIVSELEVEIR